MWAKAGRISIKPFKCLKHTLFYWLPTFDTRSRVSALSWRSRGGPGSSLEEPQEIAHEFKIDLNCVVITNHRLTLEGIDKARGKGFG